MSEVPLFYSSIFLYLGVTAIWIGNGRSVGFHAAFPIQGCKSSETLRRRNDEVPQCPVLHTGPKDLHQQWERPELALCETPLGTPQQQGCSSTHLELLCLQQLQLLPFPVPHIALQSCRKPPPHMQDFWCQELLTQVLLPSPAGRICSALSRAAHSFLKGHVRKSQIEHNRATKSWGVQFRSLLSYSSMGNFKGKGYWGQTRPQFLQWSICIICETHSET